MNDRNNSRFRHGSTMIEVVIATLLSGVVIVGALNVMGGATKTRVVIATSMEGPALANELLAEIMSQSYEDPEAPGTGGFFGVGKESGETSRSTFDDVDDYLMYSESPPLDSNDLPMAQYPGWTRSVSWTYGKRSDGSFSFMPAGLTKVIVTVTSPEGAITRRYGFRWKEGALEQTPAIDTEMVTWVGAELQIGALGVARAGTNFVNAPTD